MDDGEDGSGGDRRGRRRRLLWWVLLSRALLVICLGVAFLASGTTRPVLGNLIAVYWLLGALVTLRWVRAHRGAPGMRLATVAGVLGVTAAVVALARSLLANVLSGDTILALFGATAVLTGAMRLLGGFRDEEASPRKGIYRVVLGLTELGLGVVLIAVDELDRTVASAAGVWGLVGGTIMLLDVLDLRRRTADAGVPD